MNKLSKNFIRRLIMQEMAKIVDEDALINRGKGEDSYRDTGFNPNARSPHNMTLTKTSDAYTSFGGGSTCKNCGCNEFYEGECMECGYAGNDLLSEGDCGCGTCDGCNDGSDYSTDSMGILRTMMGAGAQLHHHHHDDHHHSHGHDHKRQGNNYMAKPSLYKVAKYSQKLLQMIPDGYELDDWQRTKIAQLADDISEVYHSLDYDFSNEF